MLGLAAYSKHWEIEEYGEEIAVTDEMRAKYDTSQAGKSGAKGKKLTYTNPDTEEKTAFFIPRNKKGIFERRKEILVVINERGVIATGSQLEGMLGKKASAKHWKVEEYGK